ncbi:MAG: LuxR C-terminal-related transcriptional regulator [Armatimonadota bacterium]
MAQRLNRGEQTCIAVVHFSSMFRDLLARRLSDEEEFSVVGVASSVVETRLILTGATPNIVIMSLSLLDGSGIDLARELAQEYPDIAVIFLASHFSTENLALAVSVGARGYIFETCSLDYLLRALQEVAQGGYAFDTGVLVTTLRESVQHAISDESVERLDSVANLSPREQEILVLVSQGLTNKEIANAAYVSINTVKTHLRRIFQELGVSSRREITRGHFVGAH